MIIKCDYCGKEFNKPKSHLTKHNYCCKECANLAQTKKQKVVCEQCGKEFLKKLCEIQSSKHHYCSKECYEKFKNYKIIEVECAYCGKKLLRTEKDVKDYKKLFCNNECKSKYQRKYNEIIIKDDYAEIIIYRLNERISALIDVEDIEKVKDLRWIARYDKTIKNYYIESVYKRKSIKLHRLIMNCPKGLVVDHINHNTTDNRKQNLRVCTVQQNSENRKGAFITNVTSGYRNVYWDKSINKWMVRLGKNYKGIYGGHFANLQDAVKVAKDLRYKYYGIKEV